MVVGHLCKVTLYRFKWGCTPLPVMQLLSGMAHAMYSPTVWHARCTGIFRAGQVKATMRKIKPHFKLIWGNKRGQYAVK